MKPYLAKWEKSEFTTTSLENTIGHIGPICPISRILDLQELKTDRVACCRLYADLQE